MRRNKRVLLKFSGEVLSQGTDPIDGDMLSFFSQEIKKVCEEGIELALVCGGGNIFRSRSLQKTPALYRTSGDKMGMLATVINSIAIMDALKNLGLKTNLFTSTHMPSVSSQFCCDKAKNVLSKGEVVLIAGGTGNPFFTTDTAAVLRALEIEADFVAKGTDVEGVFDSNPKLNKDAKIYQHIDYQTTLSKGLKVMDLTAFTLAKENKIPIRVFNIKKTNNLLEVAKGNDVGTLIS